jgi:aspartate kinase
MLATGERLSTRLLSAYLQHEGIRANLVNAHEVIISSDDYLAAVPDEAGIQSQAATNIKGLLRARTLVIIGANSGGTRSGHTTRIGPDNIYEAYSALAVGCDCTGLWLMQRRDGMMIADPRLLPEAQSVPVLPLHFLDDLASYGFGVPAASAFKQAVKSHIPIYIRNMNNPAHPGTYIHPEAAPDTAVIIVTQKRMHHLSVTGTGLEHADVVALLAANRLPVLATEATFLIPAEQIVGGRTWLSELLPGAQFAVSNDSGALITLLGLSRDMTPYIESVLKAAQIQPAHLIITSGYSSRRHLSILVPAEQLEAAVRKIYKVVARQTGDPY